MFLNNGTVILEQFVSQNNGATQRFMLLWSVISISPRDLGFAAITLQVKHIIVFSHLLILPELEIHTGKETTVENIYATERYKDIVLDAPPKNAKELW